MRKGKGTFLIVLGAALIAASLLLTVYNMQTELKAGAHSAQILEQLTEQKAAQQPANTAPTETTLPPEAEIETIWQPDYVRFPEMEMPAVEFEGHLYIGTLRIPSLGLELPVMSDWSYPQLKIAPCRFSGSAYQNDLIVIAHNYNSHFGQLKKLMPGEEISFTDMAGNVFCYAVAETEILKPRQMEELVGTDYPLTLLTCTIGGETRVTVRCEKTGEIPAR